MSSAMTEEERSFTPVAFIKRTRLPEDVLDSNASRKEAMRSLPVSLSSE